MTVAEAVTLIAVLTSAFVSVTGVLINAYNAIQINKVHIAVNSQSTVINQLSRDTGHAEGVADTLSPLAGSVRPPGGNIPRA